MKFVTYFFYFEGGQTTTATASNYDRCKILAQAEMIAKGWGHEVHSAHKLES